MAPRGVPVDSANPNVFTNAAVAAASLATGAEVAAGTVADKAVTPATLQVVQHNVEPINVGRYGFTKADVIDALDDAEARGFATVVYFPAGTYDVGTGLSLSGYSSQIRGDGAAGIHSAPDGTIFHATSQTGPVLDFTGWEPPGSAVGRVNHGGFWVVGSNVADATKVRAGVKISEMGSASFADIAVMHTGGPCWYHDGVLGAYLCDFDRITLNTPVSAKTNDVPYALLVGSNGNRYRGWGLRSITASADVGVSGAVIVTDNGTETSHDNLFDGWWVEFLHVPTNGTLFDLAGSLNKYRDFQWFDLSKEAGATGTSYIRLRGSVGGAVGSGGGNEVSGYIPGGASSAGSIDVGIDVRQSRNRITGIKGFKGNNVMLASGVLNTTIELGGAESGATDPAVIDNSGSTTNYYMDHVVHAAVNEPAALAGSAPALRGSTGEYWAYPCQRSTAALVDGTLHTHAVYVPRTCTVNRIGAQVTVLAAASTVTLGIYEDDGTGNPGVLLLDAGTIDGGSATAQEITISQLLVGGRLYHFASMADNGTPTVRTTVASSPSWMGRADTLAGATGVTGNFFGRRRAGIAGSALPSPAATTALHTTVPIIAVRFA